MSTLPDDLPDSTMFLLAKAYQSIHGCFKKKLRPYGLTAMQHMVLEGLWYREGVTAAELGKLLVLDKATLSGILDRMVAGGWVVKKHDTQDRRIYHLYPSRKANGLREELVGQRKAADLGLLKDFTPEEQTLLKRMLHGLI